jgi:hypothetical protein
MNMADQEIAAIAKAPWAYASEDITKAINQLIEELHLMKTSGMIEVAIRNPNVLEYMQHWEGRAIKAELALEVKA